MNPRKRSWVTPAFSQYEILKSEKPHIDETKNLESEPTNITLSETPSQEKKENLSNWMESFAPTTIDDLAVHSKKIDELKGWFKHCDVTRQNHPAQICLLSGPTGCGKTAATRVLAQAHQYQLREWINPIDQEAIRKLGDQTTGDAYVGSQIEAFKAFLLRASRYKSLLSGCNKSVLLVEDFPNALLNQVDVFESILEEYMNYGKAPLIFIAAETKSKNHNICYNLFPEHMKDKFRINHITFNPVAMTLLQKAMKQFCSRMSQMQLTSSGNDYKLPKQSVIDSIVVCAQGDIRNALINLHFASLKGAPSIETKELIVSKNDSNKSRKKRQKTLKSIGRDESLTLLHAVGRVLNPKFDTESKFVHSPEEISEVFATEPKRFISFLHANYLPHFKDIEDVVEAANGLSLSDFLLTEYREEFMGEVGLNVAVRNLMVANKSPVNGWMPVRGPKHSYTHSQYGERHERLKAINRFSLNANISSNLYASDYRTFINIICRSSNVTKTVSSQ